MEAQKKVRCAIYTRKSTDEGLDKEFNTLEAQREAGANYILSQKHQGWVLLEERYDDGGFSGGNINRPALKRLIHDVEAGKIDMIVVYKIDRLTRSLADFSKLIEVLDKHKCSFVSVTQNFNTYDSMGRLVFNDSVKEFLNLKRKLGNYFDEASKEDIFDYIPPQKTNQIYTPKKVVVEMVDSLLAENPECFDDPNKTFIDLYMKSGLYITEIVKRLYRNEKMKQAFPNDKERLQHIFANQVYGLAPTEIIYRIAIAYILGFSDEIKIEKHNLRQFDTLPAVQSGNLEQKLDEIYAHN